jgi:membrane protein implicated in regulation of membrane protease activity
MFVMCLAMIPMLLAFMVPVTFMVVIIVIFVVSMMFAVVSIVVILVMRRSWGGGSSTAWLPRRGEENLTATVCHFLKGLQRSRPTGLGSGLW